MNPSIHELSGRYCPFCMNALWKFKASGLEFCSDDPECGYEVRVGGKAPLSLRDRQQWELNRKRERIEHHQNAIACLRDECAKLERLLGNENR
jgi:hypothetical protein